MDYKIFGIKVKSGSKTDKALTVFAFTFVLFLFLSFLFGIGTCYYRATKEIKEKGLKSIVEDVWEGEKSKP